MGRELTGSEDPHTGEMKERLEELGYIDGGHVYEFRTLRTDLDPMLEDIEDETGLRFRGGDDGHAELAGDSLRITSKEKLSESQVEGIGSVV